MIYAYLKTHVTNSAYFVANINVIVYIYTIPKSFFTILFFLYLGGGGACLIYIKLIFLTNALVQVF